MTDYRELTDLQLQRRIAERLGYTNLKVMFYWTDDMEVGYGEDERLRGDFNGHTEVLVPEWPADLNAAVALFRDERCIVCLGYTAEQNYPNAAINNHPAYIGRALNRASFKSHAHALCLVWLALQDEKVNHDR